AVAQDGKIDPKSVQRFENDHHKGIGHVLALYMDTHPNLDITAACVDVAGPVSDGKGQLTNRPWSIDCDDLKAMTGAKRTAVLNDMQAQGIGAATLPVEMMETCKIGSHPTSCGPKMVVNVGTGFNSALILDDGADIIVPGSETGHATLPVQSEELFRLHQFITDRDGFAAVEDVLSGRGIVTVYEWHSATRGRPETKTSHAIFGDVERDPIAAATVATFVQVLGHVCANLALTHLPYGGIYLVGGMARAIAPHMSSCGFADAFHDKGRFSGFLQDFSINLVTEDNTALFGCINHLDRMKND
ncbi:MAG: glucokinase, partial [Planktomarina sp.]